MSPPDWPHHSTFPQARTSITPREWARGFFFCLSHFPIEKGGKVHLDLLDYGTFVILELRYRAQHSMCRQSFLIFCLVWSISVNWSTRDECQLRQRASNYRSLIVKFESDSWALSWCFMIVFWPTMVSHHHVIVRITIKVRSRQKKQRIAYKD